MKKIVIILVVTFILGISLTSCRSNKPPCPAYASNVENVDNTNV